MSNASNLSTLANVLDDGSDGQFLKSTGSGGVAFDTVAAGAVVYATADLLPLSGFAAGDMAYVTATNRFYINNGSGWYSISLVNTNPNITSVADASSGTTPFTLATDQTATVITITAADPEDVPLTYGYSVTSGSLNGSTVTQGTGSNTNVFTVTPHASQDATFTITFTASDGINQATSANAFSLTFVTVVTDSNHTTLLATATGTSDNNNITDSSSNTHSITVAGDAHAGTFSPYRSGGYSMNFGSGASLQFAEGSTSDFNMGTNAFTIEMWIRPATTSSGSKRFYQNRISSMGNGKGSIFQNGSNLYATYRGDNGTDYELTASGVLTADTWTHVCLLRNTSDNTLKLYYDGTLGQSVSVPSTVGIYNSNSNTQVGLGDFGDIANLRVVNGTAITPSSSSILEKPENVTNTVLLMIGGNFADYSGNAPQINNYYGPPEIKAYGPLDYTEYSTTDYGGSVYFDGSGDKLTVGGPASDFNFGTNSFTIEGWVYPQVAAVGPIFATHAVGTTSGYYLSLLANNGVGWGNYVDSTGDIATAANTIEQKVWNHISVNRDASSSNSLKIYVNGVLKYTGTSSTNFNTFDYGPFVGGYGPTGTQYDFTGYISDLVVVNGSVLRTGGTSVGDVAFTPPATPIATPSNTKLHLKGTDASIIDKSQGSNLKLEGSTTGSTTQVKFAGTKSMKFDSVDDKISVSGVLDLSQACTWEAWVYFDNHPDASGFMHMFQSASYSSTNPPFGIRFKTTGSAKINFVLYTTSGDHEVSSTNAAALDTWHHLAFSRTSSGVYNIYLNGTRYATFTESATYQSAGDVMVIGNSGTGTTTARHLDGYMQDIRITQGLARYTAADESANIPTAPLEG